MASSHRSQPHSNSVVTPKAAAISSTPQNPLRLGWTQPNAKCPRCGAEVYFYASKDGGRVYFEELGPPWPKHLCFELTSERTIATEMTQADEPTVRWDHAGWMWLRVDQVTLIGAGGLHRLMGFDGINAPSISFRLVGAFEVEIARYMPQDDGGVLISFLARDEQAKQWLVCEGLGTLSRSEPPAAALAVVQRIDYAPCNTDAGSTLAMRLAQIDEEIEMLSRRLQDLHAERESLMTQSGSTAGNDTQ
jgi:hypothetical protein